MKELKRITKPSLIKASGKVAILPLGMHRSGTSLLAGILDCFGCKGPMTQIEANERNPKGFFESVPIFRLNDEVLLAAGTHWDDWQPLREDWLYSPRFNEFRSRAIEVLKAEYGDASMIYLKDPRICRVLPLWRQALEEMGFNVLCIHTHRHPTDVAESLKARKNIEVEPSLGMLSWLRHVLEAELLSRDLPRIFTSYVNLIDDWQKFANRAEETFGFTWPVMPRTAQQRVVDLVDPNLRHHQSSIHSFLGDPLVPELFRETLQILENWVQFGENKDDHEKMDKVRHSFDSSAPLLFAPIVALEKATSEVKALASHKVADEERKNEIKDLLAKLNESQSQQDQLGFQQKKLQAELDQSHADIEVAEAKTQEDQEKIEDLSTKLTEVQGQKYQLASQREQLRAELDQSRANVEVAEAKAQEDQEKIEELSTKLTEAEERALNLVEEVANWTDRLIARDKKLAELQKDVDVNRRELATKSTEITELLNQLSNAKGKAQEDQEKIEDLSTKLIEAEERALNLVEEVANWADRLIDRDKKLAKLQKDADINRHELAVKSKEISRLLSQLNNAEMKHGQHLRDIENLHNTYKMSTSWKVSAPLRFIKSRFNSR